MVINIFYNQTFVYYISKHYFCILKIKFMITKLKLTVDVYDDYVSTENGRVKVYGIKITFYDKDKRFEPIDGFLKYESKEIKINSYSTREHGSIHDEIIFLPTCKNMGFGFNRIFSTDNGRKKYLKKVYNSLLEWSNKWEGFKKDTETTVLMENNNWIFQCEEIFDEVY